ncbi:MAG: hypothetical protein QF437_12920 [Planctomycetota bacterium]|nr:hypothetical protein [Planctomycetota bacterium]MDP7131389.1 hypothetical protein [Planctomycetota bacterium]
MARGADAFRQRATYRHRQYILRKDHWGEDSEIAFIPQKDGEVTLYLKGRPYASKSEARKLLPVWGYFHDVVVARVQRFVTAASRR